MGDRRALVSLLALLLLGVIAAAGEARRATHHGSISGPAGPSAGGSPPVAGTVRQQDATASFRTFAAALAAGDAFAPRCFRARAQREDEICF